MKKMERRKSWGMFNATVGSSNVVNQVLYEFDTNGLLAKDFPIRVAR